MLIVKIERSLSSDGYDPHGGSNRVGPKTVVVGSVVVECLLALAELARRKAAAVERMNVDKVAES